MLYSCIACLNFTSKSDWLVLKIIPWYISKSSFKYIQVPLVLHRLLFKSPSTSIHPDVEVKKIVHWTLESSWSEIFTSEFWFLPIEMCSFCKLLKVLNTFYFISPERPAPNTRIEISDKSCKLLKWTTRKLSPMLNNILSFNNKV